MKKKKRLDTLRGDNRGFSLVELLVAVTILAIIVAPLLHTFVTASATTVRSRRLGDATLASQNVAEAVEANSLSELFRNPGEALRADTAEFYAVGDDGKLASEPFRSGQDVYRIGLTGLQAGSASFDALVTLDSRTAPEYAGESFYAVNAQKLSDYSDMDAVFAQSWNAAEDPDRISLTDFQTHAASISNESDPRPDSVTRVIHLTVGYDTNDDGSLNTDRITAALDYAYTYTYQYEEAGFDETGTPVTQVKTDIWKNTKSFLLFPRGFTVTNGVMPNLYLMYNPWYGTGIRDTITITNGDDLPFTLFLVKQRDPSLGETELAGKETTYAADVTLEQSETVTDATTAKVYSNVRENLTNTGEIPGAGVITGVSYKIRLGRYRHRMGTFGGDANGALVSKSARDRIYRVTIDIYAPGADYDDDAPLCSFTTTKLQ